MYTIGMSCRRRGTSTILGTIIFVGIIFSAFIPMMLVIKQADTLHEIRKHELGILDQERRDEEVYVYVYPVTEASTTLTLKVQNRGNLVVNVVQVWINDDPHPFDDFKVQPMSWHERNLDYFTAVPSTHYFIMVTTDKGNLFSSDSGSLYYGPGGTWAEGMFAINFFISYPAAGWFDVEIRQGGAEGPLLAGTPFQIHKSSSGPAFDFFDVPSAATYYVKITKNLELIYEDDVTIGWPNGPPIEWVFA